MQVLDEINDQTDQMEQIQQAMGQPIGSAADIDEDDLLNELEVRHRPSWCSAEIHAPFRKTMSHQRWTDSCC